MSPPGPWWAAVSTPVVLPPVAAVRRHRRRTAGLAAAAVIAMTGTGGASFAQRAADIGSPPAQAGCSPTVVRRETELGPTEPLRDLSTDPGLQLGGTGEWPIRPPVGGTFAHGWQPDPARTFRTSADRPPLPVIVTAILRGATVVWYRPERLDPAAVDQLRAIADSGERRILVVPWHASDGTWTLPAAAAAHADDPIAITGWLHQQFCAEVSGRAIIEFSQRFPPSQAPAGPRW